MRLTANKRNILQQSILSVNDGILSALSIIMVMDGSNIFRPWLGAMIGGLLAMGSGVYTSVDAIANQQNKYSPTKTMISAGLSFLIGAFIPVIPLLFISDSRGSFIFSAIFLFAIGYKNHGNNSPVFSAVRQSIIGAIVAILTYCAGLFI